MKLLSILFCFLLTFTVFADDFGSNNFNADGTVKGRRKVVTFAKNSAGATLNAGDVVCHDLTADDGISFDYCTSLGDPAAYCMLLESCADGVMCKCLIEGYTSVLNFSAAGDNASAGDAVYSHSADGLANAVTVDTTAEAAYKIIGTFLDAASTTSDVEAYLRF